MRWQLARITVGVMLVLLVIGAFFLFKQEARQEASGPDGVKYTVTDSAGRQVEIPRRPQRVIVLNASNLELFYAAGGKVVGRPTTEALPLNVLEAVRQVPEVGTTPNPNIEQIIALQPDLILGVNMPFHHSIVPVLEQAGIPVLLQSLNNYQDILDTLHFYGELTGQPEQAAAVIGGIQSRYEAILGSIGDRPGPRVVIIWGTPESFHMATANSFAGNLAKRLGAVNVADQVENSGVGQMGYVPLSMEYVAKQNPDRILLITHSSDAQVGEKFRTQLANHPAWQGLKAVAGQQIYQLPYRLFAVNPGTQVGEAMGVLKGYLYPEVNEP